jgi:transcriptional regulator with XRE-family HTH domain
MTYAKTLSDYLKDSSTTQSDLAKRLKISQPTINRYIQDMRFPSHKIAKDIEAATNGSVPYTLWFSEFMERNCSE